MSVTICNIVDVRLRYSSSEKYFGPNAPYYAPTQVEFLIYNKIDLPFSISNGEIIEFVYFVRIDSLTQAVRE